MLATSPVGRREDVLAELLSADVAAVLGHPDAAALPAGRSFDELGFDSLMAVQVRNRLSTALRLRLSAAVVFEHPTARGLARHVLDLLDDLPEAAPEPEEAPTPTSESAPAPGRTPTSGHTPTDSDTPTDSSTPTDSGTPTDGRPPQTLSTLYRQVCEAGQVVAAMHMLVTASWAVPTFGQADSRQHALPPLRRARGFGEGPVLVFFTGYHPPVAAPGGEFATFHAHFQGEWDVLELPHPGIGSGRAVPADRDALALTHAETVQRHVGDRPFVIAGVSTGGAVAHAVTRRLETTGTPPLGQVLLDTYLIDEGNSDKPWLLSLPAVIAPRLGGNRFTGDEDAGVAALGAYTRMFLDWDPEPVGVPTLLVRATQPTPEMAAGAGPQEWRTSWPLPHSRVDVPGDHFSFMREHSGTAVAAVRTFVDSLARTDTPSAPTAQGD
uniref:thioesterase domain-containing protein n=1 Tax=Streptomyces resistomycificus TaxID=67356 RepID=UPI000691FB0A|nr:thioesterase domain-containing protein [Streptomyces resistomycificus]